MNAERGIRDVSMGNVEHVAVKAQVEVYSDLFIKIWNTAT